MSCTSLTYRLTALALVLSFTLGAALPAMCMQEDATPMHADMANPTAPCPGACHAGEQPAEASSTTAVTAQRFLPKPTLLPPVATAPAVALRTPFARSFGRATRAGPSSASHSPVRLHVFHAVFLN